MFQVFLIEIHLKVNLLIHPRTRNYDVMLHENEQNHDFWTATKRSLFRSFRLSITPRNVIRSVQKSVTMHFSVVDCREGRLSIDPVRRTLCRLIICFATLYSCRRGNYFSPIETVLVWSLFVKSIRNYCQKENYFSLTEVILIQSMFVKDVRSLYKYLVYEICVISTLEKEKS